ncbi:MAG: sugar ABC transporter permease [Spirochaetia bacterium]|nr:sugar ABC transporter permease [Spirochaetia bacterium]
MKLKTNNKNLSIEPSGWYWLLYILPALFIYIIFMAYPLLDSLRLSFYTGTTNSTREFIGLGNFKKLFTDDFLSLRYKNAFLHTIIFFFINMIFQNGLGILFAVIITTRTMKARSFYQTVIFIPTTFAVLVTGYLWKLLLNPIWAGDALSKIGLGFLARPWLGTRETALIVVSLISCWQWMGIPTMMFIAALKNIPQDCLEVASIEGATAWQTFTKIKLPLIKPVIGMVTILTFVNNFNAFDIIFATETVNGAPNYATDLLGTFFYRIGIAGEHPIAIADPGLGATVATITFIVLLLGVIPILRATRGDN